MTIAVDWDVKNQSQQAIKLAFIFFAANLTLPSLVFDILTNFTELFLIVFSTKIAQMVLFRQTKGLPEL